MGRQGLANAFVLGYDPAGRGSMIFKIIIFRA